MSATALTAVGAALWPALRSILRRIGRWVLARLVEHGAPWLLRLMRREIAAIARGIEDAKAWTAAAKRETGLKGKRRWRMLRRRLERRLARWQYGADWIATNATRLKPEVLRQFEALAERIPETAPWELAA
jgi:hypothetical protein